MISPGIIVLLTGFVIMLVSLVLFIITDSAIQERKYSLLATIGLIVMFVSMPIVAIDHHTDSKTTSTEVTYHD